MISLDDVRTALAQSPVTEFRCQKTLNVYDSPVCNRLATQAAQGRHLRFDPTVSIPDDPYPLPIHLCEDDYPGWLEIDAYQWLEPAPAPYQPPIWTELAIQSMIPAVIEFTQVAMTQPNHYLWGGTVPPHYDCSGLMQAAFASVGIRLPRDAYQQEAFTQAIPIADARPGDLIFFGNPEKATHVGLYLGNATYIHSSGRDQGRDGIGIDVLSETGDRVSQAYYRQFRGVGKVVTSYIPLGNI